MSGAQCSGTKTCSTHWSPLGRHISEVHIVFRLIVLVESSAVVPRTRALTHSPAQNNVLFLLKTARRWINLLLRFDSQPLPSVHAQGPRPLPVAVALGAVLLGVAGPAVELQVVDGHRGAV